MGVPIVFNPVMFFLLIACLNRGLDAVNRRIDGVRSDIHMLTGNIIDISRRG